MKKVFQIKLKSLTRVFAVVMAISLVTFTGCKSYDADIDKLNTDLNGVITEVAALKTSVAALQTSVNGMTYIKSIVLGTDGKLTITPSTGSAIVYDAKNYVTYDIKLENNVLTVNGVNKGTVAIPALTFGADNKLMSGSTVVADLSSWVRTLTLSADNYLVINGTKSTILIPPATVQSVDVKGITISGDVLTITKNDGTTSTITLPKTALTLTAVSDNNGGLTLNLNGVDTKVTIKNTYAVDGGFLTVNGVKTTVAIPAENKTSIIFTKDGDGNILSATISDGKDTMVVKLNPSNELLAGLLFVPKWIDGGINAVELGYMMDIPTSPAVSVRALFNQSEVTYRFNPTSADVSKTTWKFIHNSARITNGMAAPGDASTLFEVPTFTNNNDGSGKFTLKLAKWVDPPTGESHLFALQATGKDFYSGAVSNVVSDYAKITTVKYNPFISNAKKSNVVLDTYVHYRTVTPAIGDANDFDLVADTTGYEYDLDNYVIATADKNGTLEKTFAKYGFGVAGTDYNFEFSLPTYLGLDGVTNQNSFVTLDANNVLKVKAGTSVIDRNPLVLVKLKSKNGNLLAQAYIKFKIRNQIIIVTPPAGGVVAYTITAPSAYNYPALFKDAVPGVSAGDVTDLELTWDAINQYVYNPLKLTHNEFQAKYGPVTPTVSVTVNGVAVPGATLAQYPLIKSTKEPDVDTYAMKYQITPLAKFGTTVVTYTWNTGVTTDDKVKISFAYTVNKPVLDKAIIPAYQFSVGIAYPGVTTDAAHTLYTQGIKSASSYAMELNLGEGFGFGSQALKDMFGVAANKIDPATQEFIVTDNYIKSGVASYLFSQALPTQTSIPALLGTSNTTGVKMGMNPANPLDVAFRAYPVNFKTTYPNGEVDNFNYTVIFKNPLTIELESTADFDLLDIVTGAKDQIDLSKNYVVKMLGEVIFNKSGVTAKAAEYGITAPTMTYTVPNVTPAFTYAYSFVTPVATWENAGTKLTSKQKVSDATFVFGTTFASISRKDDVNVNPDLSQGARRK